MRLLALLSGLSLAACLGSLQPGGVSGDQQIGGDPSGVDGAGAGDGAWGGAGSDGGGGPADPGGMGPLDGGSAAADAGGPPAPKCANATNASGNGRHNPGQACMNCHTDFTLAGTLYSAASGGSAVAGATVHVRDANGTSIELITASNGNFYTGFFLSYPLQVWVSSCPTIIPMVATVSSPDCNSCHDNNMRVHLP